MKEKQAEIKGFLAWLEREIGAPLDTLTGHTRLRNYLGYQKGEPRLILEELLEVLRRNRRRLMARSAGEGIQVQPRETHAPSSAAWPPPTG
ncbi:MAG: hypothetical protein ACPLYD_14980 [Anaerolineae bacterium]